MDVDPEGNDTVSLSNEFEQLVEEVRAAVAPMEAILQDSKTSPERLREAVQEMEIKKEMLLRLADLAAAFGTRGVVDGIDTVSSLSVQFESVLQAAKDRFEEIYSTDIPFDGFDKLAEEIRSAITSADAALSGESSDSGPLLKAKELLQSQEATLQRLGDMASEKAREGDADGIDVLCSVREQYDSVLQALNDRIDELTATSQADDFPMNEGCAEFEDLVKKVRDASELTETALSDNSSGSPCVRKAKEKLDTMEATRLRQSGIATEKPRHGDLGCIDILSSLREQCDSVLQAVNDRTDELTTNTHADDSPMDDGNAEFENLVNEVRTATESAETALIDPSSGSSCLLEAKKRLETVQAMMLRLTDIATENAKWDTERVDILSSLKEKLDGILQSIAGRISQQSAEPSTSVDSVNPEAVAAIMAKLNDPEAKLNRRERRALQRELEVAQGIHKIYPTSQITSAETVAPVADYCSESVEDNNFVKQEWTKKSSSAHDCSTVPVQQIRSSTKPARTEVATPVVRECRFKVDESSAVLCDSVSKPFECARLSYVPSSLPVNNFLKLCRFSPSGQHITTTSADNCARIFAIDADVKLAPVAKIPLGDPIYDANWLPGSVERQLVATTAKHHPIHLWSHDGTRIASYRGINHLDELTAAYSVAFSNDGSHLYGGYDTCIRIWDTDRPGRQLSTIKTWDKQTGGQKSIVSCIAMNKSFNGVYAVATYDGSVGLYSDRSNSLECMFSTDANAITDLRYSYDGQRLFVAPRKAENILCYDMRIPGTLLYSMRRPFNTNQRVCFDIESADRYLFSGTSDGCLVVFDLKEDSFVKEPVFSKKVTECAVPCVSVFDGEIPLAALCTGERVFPRPRMTDSPSSSDSDEDVCYRERKLEEDLNNSLQLWKFTPAC
ncbi:hypothetical protein Q1695_012479 [Nippostrongylus brasiliensis]|nr:hypothetical protein Q1695_012479 [Nippostrongylus brasiliensis]